MNTVMSKDIRSIHLGQVYIRYPKLLPISIDIKNNGYAVQIREHLLHICMNGKISTVLRASIRIIDYILYKNNCTKDQLSLLVALQNGQIYMITVPLNRQNLYTITIPSSPSVLQNQDVNMDNLVNWIFKVPGILTISDIQKYNELKNVFVCTSSITPTVLCSIPELQSLNMEFTIQKSIELEDLEGEISTVAFTFVLDPPNYKERYAWLKRYIPDMEQIDIDNQMVFIIQGDTDGCVRLASCSFYQKQLIWKVLSKENCIMTDIKDPIHHILPFTISQDNNDNDGALLIINAAGRATVLSQRDIDQIQLDFNSYIDFICYFPEAIPYFIYGKKGCAYILLQDNMSSINGVIATQSEDGDKHNQLTFLVSNVCNIQVNSETKAVTIVSALGHITTIDEKKWKSLVSPYTLVSNSMANTHQTDKRDNADYSSRIKLLLEQIAATSNSVNLARERSRALDFKLNSLHIAFQFLQKLQNIHLRNIVTCQITPKTELVGWLKQEKAILLQWELKPQNASVDIAYFLRYWSIYIEIQSQTSLVSSYTFPLWCHRTEKFLMKREIVLEKQLINNMNSRTISVSCFLVFAPGTIKMYEPKLVDTCKSNLFSFSFPMLQNFVIHLIELSSPAPQDALLEGSKRLSITKLRAAFRQDQDPSLRYPSVASTNLQPSYKFWPLVLQQPKMVHLAIKYPEFLSPANVNLSPPTQFTFQMELPPTFPTGEDLVGDALLHLLFVIFKLPLHDMQEWKKYCNLSLSNPLGTIAELTIALNTMTGNLVIFNLSLCSPTADSVEMRDTAHLQANISVQASDIIDLSALRHQFFTALSLKAENSKTPVHQILPENISHEMISISSKLPELELMIQELLERINANASRVMDPSHDETNYLLARVAHLETQIMQIYWNSRILLNKIVWS